ncbi:MAG: hypothetical protein LBH34_05270 [Prevotellaceae bacterium]|nr:hypothetical protein [Prevotellaceae bacterium]
MKLKLFFAIFAIASCAALSSCASKNKCSCPNFRNFGTYGYMGVDDYQYYAMHNVVKEE